MRSVLVTGCSSGFGLETTCQFLERGWKVIATMRTPRADGLPASDHIRVLNLGVRNAQSIRDTVDRDRSTDDGTAA